MKRPAHVLTRHVPIICVLGAMPLLSACTGLFDDIYDRPVDDDGHTVIVDGDSTKTVITGTLHIDASSWTEWYYIDLPAIADSVTTGHAESEAIVCYPVPTTPTDSSDGKSGIYTYWFDVFGQGLTVNEFRSYQATAAQQEPAHWTFAVHRNNVRTNGGEAAETPLTDMAQLAIGKEQLAQMTFTPDAWSENAVWTVQDQMLNCLIGSQGITVNPVLSSWLAVKIPPLPPSFTLNNHIFILRLSDGTHAALQLENYQDSFGKRCYLTITYKYPI